MRSQLLRISRKIVLPNAGLGQQHAVFLVFSYDKGIGIHPHISYLRGHGMCIRSTWDSDTIPVPPTNMTIVIAETPNAEHPSRRQASTWRLCGSVVIK